MTLRLEHANIIVRDIEATLRFLTTAFPEFTIRGGGMSDGKRWVHVGTDETYIALNEATQAPAERWVPYQGKPGVNHLGYEVSDVDAVRERLSAAGYRDSTVPNHHPHRRRVYFNDVDGNDWEFVEYTSVETSERNDYALRDVE